MRMLSFVGVVALAGAGSVCPASASIPAQSFEHNGYTYEYTVREEGGAQIIEGKSKPDGTPFRLKVKGDRVQGVSGAKQVSFLVSDAKDALKK